jgi:diguanylate cyclase (GGDEF)-like protein/PAS domain S-box-containing protein
LRSVLHHVRDIVFEVGPDGCFTFLSDAFERVAGFAAEHMIGFSMYELLGSMGAGFAEHAQSSVEDGLQAFSFRVFDQRTQRWIEVIGDVLRSDDGNFAGCRGVMYDVTDRVVAEKALTMRAETDGLTGVLNREGLHRRLLELLNVQPDDAVTVCFLDLDGFKAVNDRLGHARGDHVLTLVAQALSRHCRESDTFGRLGGDEFVVIAPGLVDQRDIDMMTTRLAMAVAEPIDVDGEIVHLGASIGVATGTAAAGASAASLIVTADERMYAAKRARKVPASLN